MLPILPVQEKGFSPIRHTQHIAIGWVQCGGGAYLLADWLAIVNIVFVGCLGGGRMDVTGAVFACLIIATLRQEVNIWQPTVTTQN